jgi:hypothetical protein
MCIPAYSLSSPYLCEAALVLMRGARREERECEDSRESMALMKRGSMGTEEPSLLLLRIDGAQAG